MTDFKPETGDALEKALERRVLSSLLPSLIIFDASVMVICLVAAYFAAHLALWMHKGHPVAKDTYRASHGSYWLLDRDAVRIRPR